MRHYPTPGHNKQSNYEYGISIINEFAKENTIGVPKIIVDNNLKYYGLFRKHIYINMKKAKTPVKTPGFSWSYTGYKADLTPAGIIAHEFGHFLEMIAFNHTNMPNTKIEARVSSYEPNEAESWAEAMKLFILNPDLLKQGRPIRYNIISQHFTPVITDAWQIVLGNAHEKIIDAAQNWIKK